MLLLIWFDFFLFHCFINLFSFNFILFLFFIYFFIMIIIHITYTHTTTHSGTSTHCSGCFSYFQCFFSRLFLQFAYFSFNIFWFDLFHYFLLPFPFVLLLLQMIMFYFICSPKVAPIKTLVPTPISITPPRKVSIK